MPGKGRPFGIVLMSNQRRGNIFAVKISVRRQLYAASALLCALSSPCGSHVQTMLDPSHEHIVVDKSKCRANMEQKVTLPIKFKADLLTPGIRHCPSLSLYSSILLTSAQQSGVARFIASLNHGFQESSQHSAHTLLLGLGSPINHTQTFF